MFERHFLVIHRNLTSLSIEKLEIHRDTLRCHETRPGFSSKHAGLGRKFLQLGISLPMFEGILSLRKANQDWKSTMENL